MSNVAIVYFSSAGHTHVIAEAVAEGARAVPGVSATLLRLQDASFTGARFKDDILFTACDAADAIVFGCPTYMGSMAAQMKAFIDAAGGRWYQRAWKDKLAAGFTHSQGLSGDKSNTLTGLVTNAMQHGMVWVGQAELVGADMNRLGSYTGLMAQSGSQTTDDHNPPQADRATATAFGTRIATATKRWTSAR